LGTRPTNLPNRPNPLLGRAGALEDLRRLLAGGERLVTVVGTGGAGKTRLALELARCTADAYPDGVYVVELAATVEADLVATEIAAAIGLLDTSIEALERYLRSKRVLIVADNLEQIPAAGAVLVRLVEAISELTVVATSRTPLHVGPERVYDVPDLDEDAAVELFAARATVVDPAFRLTPESESTVRAICRRLEMLPLAIELAATRIGLLTADELLARLHSRLALLTNGDHAGPSRHRTLRATLAWSYDLLTPEQQRLFARLGAFSGGCTLEAAERVADASLDDLAALVDGNLVRRRDGRLAMLETIRELAVEQLAALGLEEDARGRHAAYFEALTLEHADPLRQRFLAPERANIRAALDWVTAHDRSGERGLAFACAVPWDTSLREGHERVEALLREHDVPDAARAHGLLVLARIAGNRGYVDRALEAAAEALAAFAALGDTRAVARAWEAVRDACVCAGDVEGARRAIDRWAEAAAALDDVGETLDAEFARLHLYAWSRDFDAFEQLSPRLRAQAHLANHPDYSTTMIGYLEGEVALGRDDPDAAKSRFQPHLALVADLDVTQNIGVALEGVAMSLAGSSNPTLGLRLGAAAAAHWDRCGFRPDFGGTWHELRERYFGAARRTLGDAAADKAWAEGLRTPVAEAVALALGA
jgi:predicted ATPase